MEVSDSEDEAQTNSKTIEQKKVASKSKSSLKKSNWSKTKLSIDSISQLGKSENETIESAIDGVCTLGVVLFFFHYYHNIWLRQYYDEVDETDTTSSESLTETDSSDEQSDDNKYQNLKDLKALLDAGILTQEEFDAQKKEILNS